MAPGYWSFFAVVLVVRVYCQDVTIGQGEWHLIVTRQYLGNECIGMYEENRTGLVISPHESQNCSSESDCLYVFEWKVFCHFFARFTTSFSQFIERIFVSLINCLYSVKIQLPAARLLNFEKFTLITMYRSTRWKFLSHLSSTIHIMESLQSCPAILWSPTTLSERNDHGGGGTRR